MKEIIKGMGYALFALIVVAIGPIVAVVFFVCWLIPATVVEITRAIYGSKVASRI